MITMDQLPSTESHRVTFRPLTPVPARTGTMALHRLSAPPLPTTFQSRDLTRMLGKQVAVPNWVLAVTVATTLGVAATLSHGMASSPVRTNSQTVHPVAALVSHSVPNRTQSESTSHAIIKQGPSNSGEVTALKGQIQSMNGDLQDLQRQNDALRNLTRQQSANLTSAEANLAASQDLLDGESQDLGARLSSMQQEVDGRVPGLQSGVKAATDLVNQIRKLLGMPTVNLP